MLPRKPKAPTPVEVLKHKDERVNIPTEELRQFVRDEQDRKRFFELIDRLALSSEPEEQSSLKEELARMTLGE